MTYILAFIICAYILGKALREQYLIKKEASQQESDLQLVEFLKGEEFRIKIQREWDLYHNGRHRTFGEFGEFYKKRKKESMVKEKFEYLQEEFDRRRNKRLKWIS